MIGVTAEIRIALPHSGQIAVMSRSGDHCWRDIWVPFAGQCRCGCNRPWSSYGVEFRLAALRSRPRRRL